MNIINPAAYEARFDPSLPVPYCVIHPFLNDDFAEGLYQEFLKFPILPRDIAGKVFSRILLFYLRRKML